MAGVVVMPEAPDVDRAYRTRRGTGRRKLHTDPDCGQLEGVEVRVVDVDAYADHWEWCSYCREGHDAADALSGGNQPDRKLSTILREASTIEEARDIAARDDPDADGAGGEPA